MDDKEKKHFFLGLEVGRIGWWGSLIAFISTPVFGLTYYLWFGVRNGLEPSNNPERWAHFGDYLAGTAGPIIGFASVMLLVATLHQQRMELREQRTQLRLSIMEAQKQNKILLLQSFEQTFFSWLREYKKQISEFKFQTHTQTDLLQTAHSFPEEHANKGSSAVQGVVAFIFSLYNKRINDRLRQRVQNPNKYPLSSIEKKPKIDALLFCWNFFYKVQGEDLRTSLRTLYGLLRWIDKHESLDPSEKHHYASIIRAQLSDSELILIYFNGFTDIGKPMNTYANRYALFANLEIALHPVLIDFYDEETPDPYLPSAFDTKKH